MSGEGLHAASSRCVEALVRGVDVAFTAEASDEERASMWSVDDGVDVETAASLRRRVTARLATERPETRSRECRRVVDEIAEAAA